MASLNEVSLIGRLGRDPEMRFTQSGAGVCNFSIATTDYAKAGEKPATTWHNVVAWAKTAELCTEYLHKGSLVYVRGRIHNREWEKNGEKRVTTEIVAERVQFLDPKSDVKSVAQADGSSHHSDGECPF